ncbi:methyltransferase domain-containing protein [Leptospira brenneri]|uniref:Methyltransferase domain-containing protein n=1 Tax=Leptospira brenneri TaxID=2023182 RepID=A0A5F1Z6V7_9LEPT|nr:methyltransferase domain-containing protein [Leptospira brenneri]TGK92001.1 methyltransferase domain-containing protein [Leptospira brenneri]
MDTLTIFEENGLSLDERQRKAFNQFNELVYLGQITTEVVTKCFCGKKNFRLLSRYDRFGLPFGTQICYACGLISQTLRIHPKSLPKFYDLIYWPLVSGGGEFLTPPKKDETFAQLIRNIPADVSSLKIFEVGCGSGQRISGLRDRLASSISDISMIGCDFSSAALKLAKEKGIKTIQGGLDELAVEGKCDILIMSHVFEHFPDLTHATKLIAKMTHQNSLVYIEVPGIMDLENKAEYSFNYQLYSVLAHTYNFSLSTLEYVLSTCGFVLVEGDEYVRAVFRKGKSTIQSSSHYERSMEGLRRARAKQIAYESRRNNIFLRYFRNVAKAVLGRIN